MGDKTGIEWTDATWNPTIGCSRVSEGCRHCYAEGQAARIVRMGKGKPTPYDDLVRTVGGEPRWTGKVRLVPDRLAAPLSWRKPRRIFVNSMSDLFHESLSNEEIAAVFGVMAAAPQHTFQVLTKRARRMREWFEWVEERGASVIMREATARLFNGIDVTNRRLYEWWRDHDHRIAWPLRNVHLGVSVENQAAADERIPPLLATAAAVRFLSLEPLLGPVDLTRARRMALPSDPMPERGVDWVIAGCESGPGARPADVAWFRSLRDQCAEAGVPYFLKQAMHTIEPGNYPLVGGVGPDRVDVVAAGPGSHRKPGGVIGAPYLDGVQHLAFPGGDR